MTRKWPIDKCSLLKISDVKVARRGLGIPVFGILLQLHVEVKRLIQLCKGFTNEQISAAMTSKFVAMATSYEVKDTLFSTV